MNDRAGSPGLGPQTTPVGQMNHRRADAIIAAAIGVAVGQIGPATSTNDVMANCRAPAARRD
jgi:hypothetical protein